MLTYKFLDVLIMELFKINMDAWIVEHRPTVSHSAVCEFYVAFLYSTRGL